MLSKTLFVLALAAATARAMEDVECETESFPCVGARAGLNANGYNDAMQVYPEEPFLTQLNANNANGTLSFEYIHDGGSYDFCFGFCLRSSLNETVYQSVISDLPATDAEQFEFAKECINGGPGSFEVFNDLLQNPGAQKIIEDLVLPAEVIFFIVPNGRIPEFAANPDAFWNNASNPRPLFSLAGANPECKDQMVIYEGEDGLGTPRSLFVWEDILRASGGGSDHDFGDLIFSVDASVFPNTVSNETTHYCVPGETSCTHASVHSDGYTVTMSWGANNQYECLD